MSIQYPELWRREDRHSLAGSKNVLEGTCPSVLLCDTTCLRPALDGDVLRLSWILSLQEGLCLTYI